MIDPSPIAAPAFQLLSAVASVGRVAVKQRVPGFVGFERDFRRLELERALFEALLHAGPLLGNAG